MRRQGTMGLPTRQNAYALGEQQRNVERFNSLAFQTGRAGEQARQAGYSAPGMLMPFTTSLGSSPSSAVQAAFGSTPSPPQAAFGSTPSPAPPSSPFAGFFNQYSAPAQAFPSAPSSAVHSVFGSAPNYGQQAQSLMANRAPSSGNSVFTDTATWASRTPSYAPSDPPSQWNAAAWGPRVSSAPPYAPSSASQGAFATTPSSVWGGRRTRKRHPKRRQRKQRQTRKRRVSVRRHHK